MSTEQHGAPIVTVDVWTRIHGPWEQDADEPEVLDDQHEAETFDSVEDAAAFIADYAVDSSCSPIGDNMWRVWWVGETYVHPYDGTTESPTYHVRAPWAEDVSRAVAALLDVQ